MKIGQLFCPSRIRPTHTVAPTYRSQVNPGPSGIEQDKVVMGSSSPRDEKPEVNFSGLAKASAVLAIAAGVGTLMLAGPAALIFGGVSLLFGVGCFALGSVDSSSQRVESTESSRVAQGPIHNPTTLMMI
jgi:hypothetical protein